MPDAELVLLGLRPRVRSPAVHTVATAAPVWALMSLRGTRAESPFQLAEVSAAPKSRKLGLRTISLSEVMAILAPHAAPGRALNPCVLGLLPLLPILTSVTPAARLPPCNTESPLVRHVLWPDGPLQVLGPQGRAKPPSSPHTALGLGPTGTLGASCSFQTLRTSETEVLEPGRGRPVEGKLSQIWDSPQLRVGRGRSTVRKKITIFLLGSLSFSGVP